MATHIKEVIGDFFKNSQQLVENRKKFDMIVEPYLKNGVEGNVLFAGVEKNKLVFHAKASCFSYTFNLQKPQLLKDIQREFPYIEDIKTEVR